MKKTNIAEKIRVFKALTGTKNIDIAAFLEVSKETVSNWCRNKSAPTKENEIRLLKFIKETE